MFHLLAAEGGDNPMVANLLPYITALVVFILTFEVLRRLVWPKISGGLADRENKIRNEIKSAEEAREQAKQALADYERELANAREEATRMIQQARAEAKATAEEMRKRNDTELAELRDRARKEIESAKFAAISELHAEASVLASMLASRILEREINPDDHRRLVEESLTQLEGMNN